ncbi:hypothetical protein, partial [Streptomyces sp. SBT349]|uniref:hypothetical protein n=1 Tax=Streptomyces sp. SBT349 TaxID=1580539 RepID=UPI0007C7633B
MLLRAAAAVEAASLAVLLLNLATLHAETVSSVTGPVHGAAYLAVIAAVVMDEHAPRAARWRACLPGVGGLLALRTPRRAPHPPRRFTQHVERAEPGEELAHPGGVGDVEFHARRLGAEPRDRHLVALA